MVINILSYLEGAAERFPDKTAFADKAGSFSYGQLRDKAAAMGAALHEKCGAEKNPVFVCIDRSKDSILLMLAAVYSGNFYVPIDLSLPRERLERMFETVRPRAVIATDGTENPFDGAAFFTLSGLLAGGGNLSALKAVRTRMKDTDPLYCIFTSGSTGVPKGVLISHRSVINMAEQFTEVFGFDGRAVFGNQAPFDFDVSVKDIYISLRVGGTVEILEKELFSFPKLLIERMNDRGVNTVIWAVSAMKIIHALDVFATILPERLKSAFFSGEVMPCKTLNYWRGFLPNVTYTNLYGPTEITCNCAYYALDRPFEDGETLPIGQAFPNYSVLLLDGDAQVLSPGVLGEICVSGAGLALGYINEPELTAAAFVQNPLSDFPERIYRTGDFGCYDEDGRLLFSGRRDTQIKHMGHRIELGEIEAAANSMPGIDSAVCLYNPVAERIYLLYIGKTVSPEDLNAALRGRLPRYVFPIRYNKLESFPATRTGKIDRRALAENYLK